MKTSKRVLSLLLTIVMILSIVPLATVQSSAATVTLAQLQAKYPHGKYWNGGNANSCTSNPCTHHGNCSYSGSCGCNSFKGHAIQCMGFAYQLAYLVYGGDPYVDWTSNKNVSALNSLKPGDVVRYKNNGHSIFVTGVSGETVTYADCNSDGHCIIRWNQTISKATLRASFSYVDPAPYAWNPSPDSCNCSTSYAGNYICTTSSAPLTIRSGHGTSYSAIGSIPSGATVYVSKANGTWAHVTYNGVSGYASMEYLKRANAPQYYVDVWASTKGQGYGPDQCPAVTSGNAGNSYYIWFKIAEKTTGEIYSGTNYKSKVGIYYPDGSELYSCTYDNSGTNWIRVTPDVKGTYKLRIQVSGNITAEYSKDFVVKCDGKVSWTNTSLNLNIPTKTSGQITGNLSGTYPSGAKYKLDYDKSIISVEKGDGFNFTVTGLKVGTTNLIITTMDKNLNYISSATCKVTVTANTYTVTYDANGGTGAPSNQTKVYGEPLQLSSVTPIKTGYSFSTWYGNARYYSPGSIYNENAGIVLKAIWKANTYTVKYNANGGTGTMANSSHTYDTSKALTANGFTKTGYSFAGWSTSSAATATQYADKESVKNLTATNGATVNLYARWKPNTYRVVYNANGGTGTTASSSHTYDTAKALTANGFTREGYTFLGWSINASATAVTYSDKQSVKNLTATNGGTVTLYAVWKKNPATVSSISIQSKPTKTVYTVGEKFDASGLTVNVTMSDGTTETITSGFTVSNPDMSTSGTKTVTVTYSGKTTSFTITVQNAETPANAGALRLRTPTSARVGQTVQIPVHLDKVSLGTLTFTVRYDHTKLKYVSCTEPKFGMCDVNTKNIDEIKLACIDSNAVSAGDIAVLTFEVIAPSACTTELTLTVEEAYDSGDKAVSVTGGTWSLSIVKTLLGDVNGDGKVTAIDARWVLQVASGSRVLTDEQKAVADVNGDGRITAIDARWILQVASGSRVL